ncbi:ribonuclease T2 family protein [Rhizobium sp. CAU 1783]
MQRYLGFIALFLVVAGALAYQFLTDRPEQEGAPSAKVTEATKPAAPRPTAPPPLASPQTPKPIKAIPQGTGFDFYVLALSWSPTFCQSPDGADNPDQCGTSRRYGMIVHGLWPQYERGYPEECPTDEPKRVAESLGRQMFDIMPSMGLIGHEWRKHGTCSGLSQRDYFSVTRAAFERIALPASLQSARKETRVAPEALEQQFTAANPGLTGRGMAVTCEGGKLEEVQICLTRDLTFRACPEIDRNGCRQRSISIPPILETR